MTWQMTVYCAGASHGFYPERACMLTFILDRLGAVPVSNSIIKDNLKKKDFKEEEKFPTVRRPPNGDKG